MRLLALHGQLGMASDWDSNSEKLIKIGHRLEGVDLWGYLEKGEISLSDFGKVLNHSHEDGQVLLGYSMGGRLALHAMIDQPQKWKAAVIISAHPGLEEDERESRREADQTWAKMLEACTWDEFLTEWNSQEVLSNGVMPERSALELRKDEISRAFRCWSLAEQENLLEQLRAVEIPVLWVVGEKDQKFCKLAEYAVGNLKNGQLLKIPDSGHRVPWEAETELVNAIGRFMDDVL